MFAEAFAGIAIGFSEACGGPYFAARVITPGVPVYDDGGSIVTPAAPSYRACHCQVDAATDAMRAEAGFVDQDVRLLVIGLTGDLSADDRLEVLAGPRAGVYSVQSVGRDPGAVGFEARGRGDGV